MRAAQGRFPPPSFSSATALMTQVYSPSNPRSASSCSQPNKSMVHEHFSDCANVHGWRKQRTRELVKLKGSLAPYNPVSNARRDTLCILDNSLIQRPPELIDLAVIGFESATSQLLKLQCLPQCCSRVVKDSLHSWSDRFVNEFLKLAGKNYWDLWWAILNHWNCSVFLTHPKPRWVLELLQIWSAPLM